MGNNHSFTRGAHLVTARSGYTHHGLYVGNDQVIHYSGLASGFNAGPIEYTALDTFMAGEGATQRQHPTPKFTVSESIDRATSRIGENSYNLFTNNCEHFVNWCIDGDQCSNQVTAAKSIASSGTKLKDVYSQADKIRKSGKALSLPKAQKITSITSALSKGISKATVAFEFVNLLHTLKEISKEVKLAQEDAERVRKQCDLAIKEINDEIDEFKNRFDDYFEANEHHINGLISSLKFAELNNDPDMMLSILLDFSDFTGLAMNFRSFSDFDNFMLDENSVLQLGRLNL